MGGATTYKQDDRVLFSDTGTNKTITLDTTVLPGSVTFNSTGTYTIQGTGKISGANGVAVNGGTLVLATANDYTGPTTIAAGSTLQLGTGGATGSVGNAIANNGNVVFNRTGTATYGPIAGTGTITQSPARSCSRGPTHRRPSPSTARDSCSLPIPRPSVPCPSRSPMPARGSS